MGDSRKMDVMSLELHPDDKRVTKRISAAFISLLLASSAYSAPQQPPDDIKIAAGLAEAAAKAYRAAGLPWEAKDVRHIPFKPTQNAALPLARAEAIVGKRPLGADIQKVRTLLKANSLSEAGQIVKSFSSFLPLVEQAATCPYLEIGDMDLGLGGNFPKFAWMKTWVRALCVRAEFEARTNSPRLAARDLQCAWKLSALFGESRSMIAMLVDVAIMRINLDSIQQCAAWLMGDANGLALLQGIPVKSGDIPKLEDVLIGEGYAGLATIRNLDNAIKNVFGKVDQSRLIRTGIPKEIEARAMATRHLQIWTRAKSEIVKYRNDPEKMDAALVALGTQFNEKKGTSYSMTGHVFEPLNDAASAVLEVKADIVVTRALLAAMQEKALLGRWPSSLKEIPRSWIDPFTGRPLKLKVAGDSIRIYSLGPNRKDDGGVRKSEIKNSAKADYDVVASYPPRQIQ